MNNTDQGNKYPPISPFPYHVGIIMDGNGRWANRMDDLDYLAIARVLRI